MLRPDHAPCGRRGQQTAEPSPKKRPHEGGAFRYGEPGRECAACAGCSINQAREPDYFIVTLTPEAEPTLSDRPFEVVPIDMITPFSFFRCSMPAPAPAAPPVLNTV